MEKHTVSVKYMTDIVQAKAKADMQAQETPEEKFDRNFSNLLSAEIQLALEAATNYKALISSAPLYTYTHHFPLPIYELLSPETLSTLELSDIYISKNTQTGNSNIRIIIHF